MCSNLTTGGTSFDNNTSYDDDYENISNLNVKSFNETVDLLNESKLPNPISVGRKQVFTENGIHRSKIAELESENSELKNYNKKLENEAEGLRKNLKEVTAETVKICEARIESIDLEMGNEQVESREFRRAFEMKKLELEGWRKDQRIQELEAQLENLKNQNQKIRIQKPTVAVNRKIKKFRQIKKKES
ncbi:hypothetical protein CRE_24178 [Caenorhabditis remanei]|uniref:Uncharacterized protein n=1 Tax=Caenorhabditis remanei TaxID=31234 RepID=E3N977_CAERE|nr:hypothetical protein CRE_24178 [Caenorhabditis remanei]